MQALRLRAVIYPEDGLWVAHALEMDLIGTGATEAAALRAHLMLYKETPDGKVSFPIPTSSSEVAGPYQKAAIRRFGLPEDTFKRR